MAPGRGASGSRLDPQEGFRPERMERWWGPRGPSGRQGNDFKRMHGGQGADPVHWEIKQPFYVKESAYAFLPMKNNTENNMDPVRADEIQSHEGACSDQEPKRVFLTLHPTTLLLLTAAQPPETLTSRHWARTVPRPGPRGGLTAKVVKTNHACL